MRRAADPLLAPPARTSHAVVRGGAAQLTMALLFAISFSFATKRKKKLLATQHHRIAQYLS